MIWIRVKDHQTSGYWICGIRHESLRALAGDQRLKGYPGNSAKWITGIVGVTVCFETEKKDFIWHSYAM